MGWARRKDTAHNQIVVGLRAHGIVVFDVSRLPGLGFDILCYKSDFLVMVSGARGFRMALWLPFELKTPQPNYVRKFSKPRKRALKLTDSELKAASIAPIPCVSTLEEALSYFGCGVLS